MEALLVRIKERVASRRGALILHGACSPKARQNEMRGHDARAVEYGARRANI